MKCWLLAIVAVSSACFMACGSSGGGTSGGGGGSGGEGGEVCDTSGDCQKCQGCAVQQHCQAESSACFGDQTCNTLAMCLSGCGADATCQNNCAMTAGQAAVDLYDQVGQCVICKTCPSDCAQQSVKCPP